MIHGDKNRVQLGLRQCGWAVSEYVAVLVGLVVVWQGAQAVLTLLREHHDEFSWALAIPF